MCGIAGFVSRKVFPRFRSKRRVVISSVSTVLIIGVLAGIYLRSLLQAAYLVSGLASVEVRPQVLRSLAYPVHRARERAVLPGGSVVDLDVYRPLASGGPWPAILVMPGFNRLGLDDPYIVGLADLLSSLGMIVVVPGLNDLFEFRWSPAIGRQIEAAFDHMAALQGVRPDKLGLLGLSISGGLGLGAAANSSVAERLSFAIVVAPFYDYAPMFRFIATGCREKNGVDCAAKPNAFARRIFLYNYLHLLLPATDPEHAVVREILRLRLHHKSAEADVLAGNLTSSSRRLLDQFERERAEEFASVAEQAIVEFGAMGKEMSPHQNLCGLRGTLFILHGLADPVIPYVESVKMSDECGRCSNLKCDLLTTEIYGHVEAKGEVLGRLFEHLRFFAFVLRVSRTMLNT